MERNTMVENTCSVQSGWQSYGPLIYKVFSQDDVCHTCCENAQKHIFCIWHPISGKHPPKKRSDTLKYMQEWFLSDGWKNLTSSSSS